MKINICFPFFLILFINNATIAQKISDKSDTLSEKLDAATFRKVLNNQFTQLITGQSNRTIGNFAAIDIKDAKLALNGSAIMSSGTVVSLTANAGVQDGVSALFTNSKINSNVGLQVRLNFLNPYSRMIRYTKSSTEERDQELQKIAAGYASKRQLLASRLLLINKELGFINSEMNRLAKLLDTSSHKEEIEFQLAQLNYKRDSLRAILDTELNDVAMLFKSLTKDSTNAVKKTRLEQVNVTGFSLGWFNVSYGINSQSFRLFNPLASFENQITKTNYTSHKVDIQYSYYRWSIHPGQSFFIQVGASGSYSNNLSSLNSLELSEKTEYGSVTDQRSSVKKYSAYTGDYKKNLLAGSFYIDYYHFFLNDNTIGIHIYPQMKFIETQPATYDAGFGFFMAVKDAKDDKGKSIVNFEVYSTFVDLTNENKSRSSLFNRNEIGFRVAFPIKFYTKN